MKGELTPEAVDARLDALRRIYDEGAFVRAAERRLDALRGLYDLGKMLVKAGEDAGLRSIHRQEKK